MVIIILPARLDCTFPLTVVPFDNTTFTLLFALKLDSVVTSTAINPSKLNTAKLPCSNIMSCTDFPFSAYKIFTVPPANATILPSVSFSLSFSISSAK